MISLPLILVSVWLAIRFGANLLDHAPFWNDELYHWHQSATFAAVGFKGGYYSFDDNIPIAGFSHFYAWGAWPYLLYGTIGHFFGFPLNAIETINIVCFILASLFFLWMIRPDEWQLILFGAVITTFIPLLIYLPSSMLQVLNLAIALIFAGGLTVLLRRPVGWRFVLGMSIFAIVAGLIRPTYALYLFPIFVLAEQERNLKTIFLAGLKAIPLIVIASLGFYLSAAPFPHFRTLLFLGSNSLSSKLTSFIAYIHQSLIWLTEGGGIIMAQRLQIVFFLIVLLVWMVYQWRNAKERAWLWELALHLYNLLGFYAATIMFHETLAGHDYRVMAPHLFCSLLLLLAFRRRWILGLMILAMLATMPSAWDEFKWKEPNFNGVVQQQWQDWEGQTAVLTYQADAPSAWCNTVATSSFYVLDAAGQPGFLLSIDASMGLSWFYNWTFPEFDIAIPARYQIPEHFQARYLILTKEDRQRWRDTLHLRRIGDAPQGGIFINQDVRC